MPVTFTVKESKFVPGGGVRGVDTRATLSCALPPPQLVRQGPFLTPLQETTEAATRSKGKSGNLRASIGTPHGNRHKSRIQNTTFGRLALREKSRVRRSR